MTELISDTLCMPGQLANSPSGRLVSELHPEKPHCMYPKRVLLRNSPVFVACKEVFGQIEQSCAAGEGSVKVAGTGILGEEVERK